MNEHDLLEEIGKVSEELIAANALPDAKRFGEGGADKSDDAKEHIVMREKKNEYIKNPFIRALPAFAAAAAVIVAGVIILPKTGIMRTPAASVDSGVESSAESGNAADSESGTDTEMQIAYKLDIKDARLLVITGQELEKSGRLVITTELVYTGEDTAPDVWFDRYSLEKNGVMLEATEGFEAQLDAENLAEWETTKDPYSVPMQVAFTAQGAEDIQLSASKLDPHWLQNESGDLTLTVYYRVGTPTAEPIAVTVPNVSYQVKELSSVEMPDVTGLEYENARKTLQGMDLFIDKRSAYDDEVPEGYIISSDPQGPAAVSIGTIVRVIVSLGPNKDTVIVPNFVGMDWEIAAFTADSMGLIPEKKTVLDDTTPAGCILSQNLTSGEEVAENTVIELTVASDGAADTSADGKKTPRSVRVMFDIPVSVDDLYHIELWKDGECYCTGDSFNPVYAAGVTSLTVTVEDTVDLLAVLVNPSTGARAIIGNCHIDYENVGYFFDHPISLTEAFKQVTAE